MPKLKPDAIDAARREFPDWTVDADGMARELTFADFKDAFAFMTEVAAAADRADHHPEWSNVYNRVSIQLSTHDVDGLTERDIALAREVERAAARFQVAA